MSNYLIQTLMVLYEDPKAGGNVDAHPGDGRAPGASGRQAAIGDILLQEGASIRILTPRGWSDMGMLAQGFEMREAARDLLNCEDDSALFNQLATGGAANIACTVGSAHVRIDISLVSGMELHRPGGVGDSFGRQSPILELVIRRHRDVKPLSDLAFPKHLVEQLGFRSGLILVTGAAGSGKTSSCASMLGHINENQAAHIITIQDPIEIWMPNKQSVFSNKEIGRDVPSFEVATYNAVRQKPDVIFISELRDSETCKQALIAAQSALVIATTHAPTLEDALTRVANFFTGEEAQCYRMLKSSIRCLIAQALVPIEAGAQWQMFYEYVAGNNEVLQECLSDNNGFIPLRAALSGRALNDASRATGGPATEPKHVGLVPMNGALARALMANAMEKEDAHRASPDRANLSEVHTRLLDVDAKKKNEALV